MKKMMALAIVCAGLWSEAHEWNLEKLNCTPKTFAVEMPCSNDYGRVEGVEPIWIEGELYRGKPTRIFAWWGLPKGASANSKVPAMVLVHGGGGTAFAKWVKTWNDRGYAAIAMDTNGKIPMGERDGKPHNAHPWSGPDGWGKSMRQVNEPLRDQWTYHAVAAVMRCHSFLRSRPEIERDKIGLTGISWGGYLTCIVMSVDSRFRFAVPVYGCGWYDLHAQRVLSSNDDDGQKWKALWDPKHFFVEMSENGVKGGILWCCGTNDRFFPLNAVKRSSDFVASQVPVAMSVKLRMTHSHPPAGDPKEITALADHALKGRAALPEIKTVVMKDGKLCVQFDAHGRNIAKAELLYTCDTNPVLEKRLWIAEKVKDFNPAQGVFSVDVKEGSVMYFANITTDDGLVVSTRIFAL